MLHRVVADVLGEPHDLTVEMVERLDDVQVADPSSKLVNGYHNFE